MDHDASDANSVSECNGFFGLSAPSCVGLHALKPSRTFGIHIYPKVNISKVVPTTVSSIYGNSYWQNYRQDLIASFTDKSLQELQLVTGHRLKKVFIKLLKDLSISFVRPFLYTQSSFEPMLLDGTDPMWAWKKAASCLPF